MAKHIYEITPPSCGLRKYVAMSIRKLILDMGQKDD
jgi:hypothetical protein